MASKYPTQKKTTCLTKGNSVPLKVFGSQFLWDFLPGDIILVIPATGKFFYVSTTSLSTITRLVIKLGGPNEVSALSNRITKNLRTYTISVERRFLHRENQILNTSLKNHRKRTAWTEEEWIRFFKGIGRSEGGYKLFITIWFRRLKSLTLARQKYWEIVKKAGLIAPPGSVPKK